MRTSAMSVTSTGEAVVADNQLTVFPNPFSQQATVQLSVAKAGPVTLTLLGLDGQLISKLYSGTLAAGAVQKVTLGGANLHTGMYLLRLETSAGVLHQKVAYAPN